MASTGDIDMKLRREAGRRLRWKRGIQVIAGFLGVVLAFVSIGLELKARFSWPIMMIGVIAFSMLIGIALEFWKEKIKDRILWSQVKLVANLTSWIFWAILLFMMLILYAELYWLGGAIVLAWVFLGGFTLRRLFMIYREWWSKY